MKAGRWGRYPWFESRDKELAHPVDFAALCHLEPYGKVFECVGVDGDYLILRYGAKRYRVAPDLFREVEAPAFELGEQVILMRRGKLAIGEVVHLGWHGKNKSSYYLLRINDRHVTKRYWEKDLRSIGDPYVMPAGE